MKTRALGLVILAAALSMPSSWAAAAPVCSPWLGPQADGAYWQRCINDDNSIHCWSASDAKGANAHEIAC